MNSHSSVDHDMMLRLRIRVLLSFVSYKIVFTWKSHPGEFAPSDGTVVSMPMSNSWVTARGVTLQILNSIKALRRASRYLKFDIPLMSFRMFASVHSVPLETNAGVGKR